MIKKKLKTKIFPIIALMLLLFGVMCFSACADISANLIIYPDKTIDELVVVNLEEEKIKELNIDLNSFKKEISDTALSETKKLLDEFNNKIYNDILDADEYKKAILISFLDGVKVVNNKWENNIYSIGLRFKDSDVYNYFYSDNALAKFTESVEKHFLYTKIIYTGVDTFSKHSQLTSRITAYFNLKYPDMMTSENTLKYTRVTDLRREHSNADFVQKYNGNYYHTWLINLDESKPIIVSYNIANKTNCILVCLGVSIVVCGLMAMVGLILSKTKKSNYNKNKLN